MTENIEVLTHSSVRLKGEKVLYIDPFHIEDNPADADIILITHDHFDHFSPEDIDKIKKQDTIMVVPEKMKEQAEGISCGQCITVLPGMRKQFGGIVVETVAAYNNAKPFHPKENDWVGYVVEFDGTRIYIAGDTDMTEENRRVVCDVAMIPIGGTYTMDAKEAAELVNAMKPKVAIPIHYGSITGTKEDAEIFKAAVEPPVLVEIKMP
ncbi:MAG: MBL fold metallo-hydrolase [Lachnospiraceae bacterium]|nr:MBL fold metallo-hydrolase [Lachnospiraceae bacterium]